MSLIPSFFGNSSNSFDPFSHDVWYPFEGFPMRSVSEHGGSSRSSLPQEVSSFAHARIDWRETLTAHVFKADVPGLRKDEVSVEVEDRRVLQITGERKREQEEKTNTWHRVERSSGRFSRRFKLPENARVDQIKACMEDGVLTVTVPKDEPKKTNVRSIQISD